MCNFRREGALVCDLLEEVDEALREGLVIKAAGLVVANTTSSLAEALDFVRGRDSKHP